MKTRWLFCDFDNTLMDTESHSLPLLISQFNRVYQTQMDKPLTLDVFQAHFHGLSGQHLCAQMSTYFKFTVEQPALFEGREQIMQSHYQSLPSGVRMAPGVIEALTHCKAQGVTLALVTNNPLQRAFAAMRFADNRQGATLAKLFEGNFFEANPIQKPEPDVYLRAIAQLKADPQQSFAIEDSPTGVKAACAAGLPTLGYLGLNPEPKATQARLIDTGCKTTFQDWAELPDTIK